MSADYSIFGNLAGTHNLNFGGATQQTVNNAGAGCPGGGYVYIW